MSRYINNVNTSNNSPGHDHQSFFPSDILHLRDLSSACCITAPPINNGWHHHIICHKDRTSFYKSTRKALRTAHRIWDELSNAATTDDGVVGNTCSGRSDGYFVGGSLPLLSSVNNQNDAYAAIHKRISSEFGPCSTINNVDVPNVTVRKYSSGGSEGQQGTMNCQSQEESNDERINVIFFDLDTIDSGTMPNNVGAPQKMHHDFMQTVLSMLIQEVPDKGRNSIVHIRSETIYRIVTSMGVTSNNGLSEKKPYSSVSGVELDEYFLSIPKESEGVEDSTSPSKSTVIRRLRNTKGAANCPLTIYPARFIELPRSSSDGEVRTVEICRFHNYDSERGCLRSKKKILNSEVKGCDMDHDYCHRCGGGHKAFECTDANLQHGVHLSSIVFRKSADGSMTSVPFSEDRSAILNNSSPGSKPSLPALLVLGGRLRGRTLATCEMLPLSPSLNNDNDKKQKWAALPNLCEHRGSHAACSPIGSGMAFVLGGGTADGNSAQVEILDFGLTQQKIVQPSAEKDVCQEDGENGVNDEWRWKTMAGKLSSPRHAFGAVSCITSKQSSEQEAKAYSLFAVGGWQYGSISCESMDRLTVEYPSNEYPPSSHHFDSNWLHKHARWQSCANLLLPRRLHSVAASTDGSSIFVFGGYIDERRTTPSIERYDIDTDKWSASEELPYGDQNCPLVQAVAVENSYLIFPYSTEPNDEAPLVLRYTPGSDISFSPVHVPNNDLKQELRLPIAHWHSFSATSSPSLRKVFLVGGTVRGKWTNICYELNLDTMEWIELPTMTFARRRLATVVLE